MRRMVYGLIVLALTLAACGEKEPTATAPPPPTATVTTAPVAPHRQPVGDRPAPADVLRDPDPATVRRAVQELGGEQPGP